MMQPIRVHLGLMPPMLRTMIADLLNAEQDMTVVGNSYGGEDSLPAASAEDADLVVAQENDSVDDRCLSAIISARPDTILAISANGTEGTSINLVRRSITLKGPGPLALADTIREILGRD